MVKIVLSLCAVSVAVIYVPSSKSSSSSLLSSLWSSLSSPSPPPLPPSSLCPFYANAFLTEHNSSFRLANRHSSQSGYKNINIFLTTTTTPRRTGFLYSISSGEKIATDSISSFTSSCGGIESGGGDVTNALGPPEAIRRLKIVNRGDSNDTNARNRNDDDDDDDTENCKSSNDSRDDTFINMQRPYFDPTFQDLSKPQQHTYEVSRLAFNSDVFLLKGFLTSFECAEIIYEATHNYNNEDEKEDSKHSNEKEGKKKGGMTTALTNDENTQSRSNCSVAWMGDSRIFGLCKMIGEEVAQKFVTDVAQKSLDAKRSDMQVLHYENGGKFVLHHDGFDRILTVICYLNGVGQTWLPLVDVNPSQSQAQTDLISLDEAILEVNENGMLPGSDGILLSGSKTISPNSTGSNYSDNDCNDDCYREDENNPHLVSLGPGDAVAFYSYANDDKSGQKDFRSIHAGLPVKHAGDEGKWLATCWFHAPSLVTR